MADTPARPAVPARRAALAAIAVLLLALNLRPAASSIGPVLAEIQDGLDMSAAAAGVLGALPGFGFAVFGAMAVTLAIRIGLNSAIAVGAFAAAVGLVARAVVGDVAVFIGLSLLAFAGVAVGNVLIPAFIKRHFPNRLPLMTSVYSTGLALGASIPAALAIPLAGTLPGQWRGSIGLWGVTAALACIPWVVLALVEQRRRLPGQRAVTGSMWGMLRSRKACALAVFFGVQSSQAYIQFAWIAQIYRDSGLAPSMAGVLGATIAAFGIPTGFLMPWMVGRYSDLRVLVVLLGALLSAGYLGLWLAPTTLPWLWAVFLGMAGAAFPLAIALITIHTRDPRVTTRVSGFTQSMGYLMAAVGPFLVGWLFDLAGNWDLPLGLLVLVGLLMAGSGLIAAGPGYVDDELPQQG